MLLSPIEEIHSQLSLPARYGLRITRVAAVPALLPCHSANSKTWLISESGKLWETVMS